MKQLSIVLASLLLSSCATTGNGGAKAYLKTLAGIMTPEQEVAKVFYDQNMANFLTLKPCFAETEGCYLSSKDEKIVAAAASINESCTDSLREDKTTFNQHRAQAPPVQSQPKQPSPGAVS